MNQRWAQTGTRQSKSMWAPRTICGERGELGGPPGDLMAHSALLQLQENSMKGKTNLASGKAVLNSAHTHTHQYTHQYTVSWPLSNINFCYCAPSTSPVEILVAFINLFAHSSICYYLDIKVFASVSACVCVLFINLVSFAQMSSNTACHSTLCSDFN